MSKFLDVLDMVKTLPDVQTYAEKAGAIDSEVDTKFSQLGSRHREYTLALATRVRELIPDLTFNPVNVQISPLSVQAGQLIAVTYTVINSGDAPLGYFTIRVSLDSTRPWGTSILLDNFDMLPLDGGSSRQSTEYVLIPQGISPGDYYVTVYADVFKTVRESNEMNNIASTEPLKLTVAAPSTVDLAVT